MAQRNPFGNRRSAAGKAANEAAAKKAAPPAPAPTSRRGIYESQNKPTPAPTKSTPKSTTSSAVNTATSQTDPLQAGKENASTFMSIIGGMPPETRNRYLSAYTDFLALPADQQTAYLSGLEQQAKDIVEPKITQDRTRLNEDFEYERKSKEREKVDLQATFDRIVGDMDFDKNRDIAKENKTAAKVMQNVGNTAFVTGVAGSGIFSRRTAYVRESLQDNVDDINIDFNKNKNQLLLKKSQGERSIDSEIDRLFQLNKRDLTDLDQTAKEDELSMFFELAGNKFGQKGEQNSKILEAGGGSAAEDFAAGGTDTQRKTRLAQEIEAKRVAEEQARIGKNAGSYQNLFRLSQALKYLGRTSEAAGLKAEMGRISGDAGTWWSPRMNNWGMEDIERGWEKNFLYDNNLLYQGMNEEARKKLNAIIDGQRDLIQQYNP